MGCFGTWMGCFGAWMGCFGTWMGCFGTWMAYSGAWAAYPAEERAVVASKLVMCQKAQDYGFFFEYLFWSSEANWGKLQQKATGRLILGKLPDSCYASKSLGFGQEKWIKSIHWVLESPNALPPLPGRATRSRYPWALPCALSKRR